MRGLPRILSLFRNELNKFNNTGARISYDIEITQKSHCWLKKIRFCHNVRNVIMDVITFPGNL